MKVLSSKLLFIFLFFIVLSIDSYSQCLSRGGGGRGGNSNFSIELGAGVPIPITPSNDIKFGDAKKGELGLRYLPQGGNLGIRGYYAYMGISDSGATPSDHGNSLKVHRVELQGIYMLDDLLGVANGSIFELESYLGAGAGLGKPSSSSGSNKMLAATIGLRPRFLIDNNRLHVYVDTSYGMLFNQRYDYAGEYIPGTSKGNMESSLQVSVGLSYRL